MIGRTKESWRRLRASEPGQRFEDRWRRRREDGRGWRDPRRLLYVAGGLVLVVGSLFMRVLPTPPGPGTLAFLLGLGTVAGESRPVARLLDRAEVGPRRLARWGGGVWRSSAAGKASVVSAAVCSAAVLCVAYLAYLL